MPGLTKSSLYRGEITDAAVTATLAALRRIERAEHRERLLHDGFAKPEYRLYSVKDREIFPGGKTRNRPLLRASDLKFDVSRHSARSISRRIRCAGSHPGVSSNIFGLDLCPYGGQIENGNQIEGISSVPKV